MIKKSDIIFKTYEGKPDFIVYFDYDDAVFTYTASIIKPHEPDNFEKENHYDTSKYIGQNWAAPIHGGGFNRVSYIDGDTYEEVESKLIDEIIKWYWDDTSEEENE